MDGHAYTVITCLNDVGGTEHDLVKVRNPWGKGGTCFKASREHEKIEKSRFASLCINFFKYFQIFLMTSILFYTVDRSLMAARRVYLGSLE